MKRARIALVALAAAFCSAPPADAQETAPPPARDLLAASTDFVLQNGMRVYLVPDAEVPLVAFQMRLAGGSCEDPQGAEGVASVLASLLMKGAGARDARLQEDRPAVPATSGRMPRRRAARTRTR